MAREYSHIKGGNACYLDLSVTWGIHYVMLLYMSTS